MLNIIIYGTGLMGRELLSQIECYNRINKEKIRGGGYKGIGLYRDRM